MTKSSSSSKPKKEYKRKFMIPGDTIVTCDELCKDYDSRKCYYETLVPAVGHPKGYPILKRDMNRCPHKEIIHQPRQYVVSEYKDGTWGCSCKGWIFKYRKLGEDCGHIIKARKDPKKYEIPIETTTGTIKTFKELLG